MSQVEPSWREVSDLLAREGSEANVARRIRELRESQVDENGNPAPWSHTDLARRLATVGEHTDRTALWKIENPDKRAGRRRISIAELIAFARVFNVTIAELLLPPDAAARQASWTAVHEAAERLNEVRGAWDRYVMAVWAARDAVDGDEVFREQVEARREDAWAARTAHLEDAWRRHEPESDLSEFAQRQTTPLLAALDDILSDRELNEAGGWSDARTLPIPRQS